MIKMAFLNLFRRKSRTFLSVLGIAIGVAAIIGLVSVVDGVSAEYTDIMTGMQGIMIMEKDALDQTLSKMDSDLDRKISSVQGVKTVLPEVWLIPDTVDGKRASESASGMDMPLIYGVDMSVYNRLKSNIWLGEIGVGSLPKPGETGSVVIGKALADKKSKFVGSSIKVDGKRFRVVGILGTETMGFGSIIFMDIADAREITGFPSDTVSTFYVELTNPEYSESVAKRLEFVLGDDGEAWSTADISEMFTSIMGSFNIVVLLIGGLSAFVAGVGIINTILMSVLDRTRELGALLATGWTGKDIMKMILYEALFIGMMGGVAGIILGIGVSEVAISMGLPSFVSLTIVIQAFIFAVGLGLVAGIYPAYRASKLNPIEAIHGG